MSTVQEHLDIFPFDTPPVILTRREALLLDDPVPSTVKAPEPPPIEAIHYAPRYSEQKGPQRNVYESPYLRIERHSMAHGRQRFYHRNTGADEISYQVDGQRLLMTELGSVDLVPGEFVRLPNGVAHDNYGRQDIHLLLYVSDPAAELLPARRTSEHRQTPFPEWQPAVVNEMVSKDLAGPGQCLVLAPADERLLLDHALNDPRRLAVLDPGDEAAGACWIYRSTHVWIGRTRRPASDGRVYQRHLNADEVQYQVSGRRTLVTQRGCLEIEPGDFVRIPQGVAFTSIHHEPVEYLMLASRHEIPQSAQGTKQGGRLDAAAVERLRAR
ncbi:hypothetical protein [Pigmentiphaga daeguensis]|jgi:uncharacterized cupin superfamily protein|uniref:Cupin domain-containing protein n=1 Tax=Pigmentiphaga daeguensis TaxID=414049 RepID=A0ABN1C2B5_9BURK